MAEGLARGDRGMLKQVLCNLLDNALKNTPSGGMVRLNVESDHRTNPCWLTFSMIDSGPGFPKEALPKLFERFSQAGFRVRSGGGTGLGLSICKAIVDGCGGSIQIDNAPTGGARVVVKLPCG
jgi:two-component system sensor histidine kinase BaeS